MDCELKRIYELADEIYKREKNLKEDYIADLGYIKMYADVMRKRKGKIK